MAEFTAFISENMMKNGQIHIFSFIIMVKLIFSFNFFRAHHELGKGIG